MKRKGDPTARRNGYLKLRNNYRHRVVMEQHLGRKLTEQELVHHIDGDKDNNDISNLRLTTRAEHVKLHHPAHATLTEAQVLEIRASKERSVILANQYGIDRTTIWKIRTRRTWPTL